MVPRTAAGWGALGHEEVPTMFDSTAQPGADGISRLDGPTAEASRTLPRPGDRVESGQSARAITLDSISVASDERNDGDRHDHVLARNRLLVLLTLSSGAVDAICFLGLGKVFTAFMTGNFVFLGLRIASAPGPHTLSVIVSMCAFAVGVLLATRIVRPAPRSKVWPLPVTVALGVTVTAQAAFAALWLSVTGHATLTAADFLLGISALGMGFQTAAVFSLGIQGVFTTAATATFTVLSGDSAHWSNTQPERHRLAALLIALTLGAIGGGLLMVHARDFAPLLPLCVSALVVIIAAIYFPADRPTTDTPVAEDARNAPLAT
jgi:uncharacterized membrane protein YoaK (UPF0700 family)